MKRQSALAALGASIALAGCASAHIGLQSGDATAMRGAPAVGTAYSSASVRAEASANSYVGALFLGTILMGVADERGRAAGGSPARRVPDMLEGRAIEERDCAKPLGPLAGNLRCR